MKENMELYDSIIIGGGPAGLAAAIYLARAKYRVLVIEKEKIGGQITITSEVVNYPGVLKTDGTRLTENMRRQAEYFGAEFKLAEVKSLDLAGDMKSAVTDKGTFRALGIVPGDRSKPEKDRFLREKWNSGEEAWHTVPPATASSLPGWMCLSSEVDSRLRKRRCF